MERWKNLSVDEVVNLLLEQRGIFTHKPPYFLQSPTSAGTADEETGDVVKPGLGLELGATGDLSGLDRPTMPLLSRGTTAPPAKYGTQGLVVNEGGSGTAPTPQKDKGAKGGR